MANLGPAIAAHELDAIREIRILWIGRLGDMLITTPVLRSVRARFPNANVTLVVGDKGAEFARLCPDINGFRVLKNIFSPLSNLRLALWLLGGCDLLIDFNTAYSRSSLFLTRIAKARIKLGFKKRGARAFTHRLAAPDDQEHMLDRYGRLATALSAPYEPRLSLSLPEPDRQAAQAVIAKTFALGVPFNMRADAKARWVAIHPGNFKKFDNRWPEDKFVELTNRLLDLHDIRIMYLSGPGEKAHVEGIVARLKKPVPILDPLPLGVTAALLSLVDLLIVNATGSAHLAAAVGTPTFSCLARYTKTVWMPKSGPHFQVVSQSWTSCRDISVDEAWAGLQTALANLRARPSA